MSSLVRTVQLTSIFTSLASAGGIAALSLFDIPELQAQPASRSLPSIRWLFSRGSHIFPTTALISSGGFAYLAYAALPSLVRARGVGTALVQLLQVSSNASQITTYLAASALTLSIAPFTTWVMIPTNFRLIELSEAKGGARSEKTAREQSQAAAGSRRNVQDLIDGKGQPNQFTDLSGPQTKTKDEPSEKEDQEVRQLLGRFGVMNFCRAVLMGVGGVVGLSAALG